MVLPRHRVQVLGSLPATSTRTSISAYGKDPKLRPLQLFLRFVVGQSSSYAERGERAENVERGYARHASMR